MDIRPRRTQKLARFSPYEKSSQNRASDDAQREIRAWAIDGPCLPQFGRNEIWTHNWSQSDPRFPILSQIEHALDEEKTGWLAIRVRKRALACRDPSLTPHWALRKIRKRPKPFRFARKPVSCPLGWCCAVPSKQICERPRMSATWTPTWIESYIFFWMIVVECISALDENKGIWLCHKRLLKWHFK